VSLYKDLKLRREEGSEELIKTKYRYSGASNGSGPRASEHLRWAT
jgi:hypothetical protein